jgi:LCP family protein required for cell wall assembly
MERMRADGLHPPRILKINELRTHGGREDGIHYLKEQIEEMLGVDFDFYVEVRIPAFRRIVDAIGGVEMYIPRRLFYVDPDQNLRIDVPGGRVVHLDGNMAEGVVRYRQWPMGDLQRNEMQMQFMTLLIQQATTREALLNDPMEIIHTILSEVRSDIGMSAFLYIPLIPRVNMESVSTFTMPGTIGYVSGREYFIPDRASLPAIISDVFYSVPEIVEPEEEETESDAD